MAAPFFVVAHLLVVGGVEFILLLCNSLVNGGIHLPHPKSQSLFC